MRTLRSKVPQTAVQGNFLYLTHEKITLYVATRLQSFMSGQCKDRKETCQRANPQVYILMEVMPLLKEICLQTQGSVKLSSGVLRLEQKKPQQNQCKRNPTVSN